MNKYSMSRWWEVAFCVLLAGAFCLCFSISTSPLYTHYGYDSVIFQLIGKFWAEGHIPYVELWDHKGPYIFFINALGYGMTGNAIGVFLLQVLHLAVTLFFILKGFLLFRKPLQACLLTAVSLLWLLCSFDEGNLTEEYMLPWIAAVVFLTLQWTQEKGFPRTSGFNPAISLFSGIILGLGLMTRLTNAIIPCGIMLFAGIQMLVRQEWRTLAKTVLLYICGFLVSTLPFILYFAAKGALYDMWFGTFLMNFSYATGTGGFHFPSIVRNILLLAAPFVGTAVLSAFLTVTDKEFRPTALLWMLASLPYFLWLIAGKCFTHYNMVAYPLIPVLFVLADRISARSRIPWEKILAGLVVAGGLTFAFVGFRQSLKGFDNSSCQAGIDLVREHVPENELTAFNAWECHPAVYQKLGVKPCYPHFIAQAWHASFTDLVARAIRTECESLQAEWLLVVPYRASMIQDILDKEYTVVASSGDEDLPYLLYKRNAHE